MERQPWLLPYVNPLKARLGPQFFRDLPRKPGVYVMLGESERILYVGKAKSLRDRLSSYRHAKPDAVSRKVIRLINAIRSIRIEVCETETGALLRENELLRSIQPPFNVQNTRPDLYFLVGVRRLEAGRLRLRLTTRIESREDDEELYGAFKGRGAVRRGYGALLRLLWVAHVWPARSPDEGRFEFPVTLTREGPAPAYELSLTEEARAEWSSLLARFLRGTSRSLMPRLAERILLLEGIPPFFNRWIEEDLGALEEFFAAGPHRNRRLKRFHGLESQLIAQETIDDLVVSYLPSLSSKKTAAQSRLAARPGGVLRDAKEKTNGQKRESRRSDRSEPGDRSGGLPSVGPADEGLPGHPGGA
jgi:hypothetical protein